MEKVHKLLFPLNAGDLGMMKMMGLGMAQGQHSRAGKNRVTTVALCKCQPAPFLLSCHNFPCRKRDCLNSKRHLSCCMCHVYRSIQSVVVALSECQGAPFSLYLQCHWKHRELRCCTNPPSKDTFHALPAATRRSTKTLLYYVDC